jgi:hypothetical protein
MRRWAIGIVVVAIFAGGYAAWSQNRATKIRREQMRVTALQDHLLQMRKAIDLFYREHQRHPHTLEELVPKYLRRIPVDPITGSANWRLTTEETVTPSDDFTKTSAPKGESVIIDVHSTAPGYADY